MEILYIFLIPVIGLGIATTYTDIVSHKIENRTILLALTISLIMNLIIAFSGITTAKYILHFSSNFVLSVIIGFWAWHAKMWSAGDAKLFIAFVSLVPLIFYSRSFFNYFPSLVLLINTFVPYFVYGSFKITKKYRNKLKLKFLKKIKPLKIFDFFIRLFALHWFAGLFLKFIGLEGDIILIIFLMMVFSRVVNKVKYSKYFIPLFAGLRLLLDKSIFSYSFIYRYVLIVFLIFIIRHFIYNTSKNFFSKNIRIPNLKKGMVLAEGIFKVGDKYRNKRPKREMPEIIKASPEGLSESDIRLVKALYNQKKIKFKSVKVQETLPFAPFMFFGVILTILARGIFINLLYLFF